MVYNSDDRMRKEIDKGEQTKVTEILSKCPAIGYSRYNNFIAGTNHDHQ
jgi:hypothetical protein